MAGKALVAVFSASGETKKDKMQKMSMIRIALIIGSLLALSACGSSEKAASTEAINDKAVVQNASDSVVYFTSDISPEGLVRIYEKLDWQPAGQETWTSWDNSCLYSRNPVASVYVRHDSDCCFISQTGNA